MTNNQLDRFLPKVSLLPNGCWEWDATRYSNGYGRFWLDSRHVGALAHRVSYTHFVGAIPAGLNIDHLCRNRACVNPTHLEPVTQRVNSRRGARCKDNDFFCDTRDPDVVKAVTEKARNARTRESFAKIAARLRARRVLQLKCFRGLHLFTVRNTYWYFNAQGTLTPKCRKCHAEYEDARRKSQRKAA